MPWTWTVSAARFRPESVDRTQEVAGSSPASSMILKSLDGPVRWRRVATVGEQIKRPGDGWNTPRPTPKCTPSRSGGRRGRREGVANGDHLAGYLVKLQNATLSSSRRAKVC